MFNLVQMLWNRISRWFSRFNQMESYESMVEFIAIISISVELLSKESNRSIVSRSNDCLCNSRNSSL